MTRLIATMGTQPGSVYETLLNLCRGRYDRGDETSPPIPIDEVVLVYTKSKDVVDAYRLARLLIACSQHIMGEQLRLPCMVRKIIGVPVDVEDIDSRQSFESFYNTVRRSVSQGDIIDVTGGRVAMGIAAARAAWESKAMIVASVIPAERYSEINAAKRAILATYDIGSIVSDLEHGKLSCLELADRYRGLARDLSKLVTGKASTYLLYP